MILVFAANGHGCPPLTYLLEMQDSNIFCNIVGAVECEDVDRNLTALDGHRVNYSADLCNPGGQAFVDRPGQKQRDAIPIREEGGERRVNSHPDCSESQLFISVSLGATAR